ncbi:MAG: GNAT family N-acetyltransferase [Planctomycetaceae bacterium]|nr:GNAT family N-acetyltransferase [Planctomycetaceae bacterium]
MAHEGASDERRGDEAALEVVRADRAGLSRLVEMARAEGWLPGAGDDDAFWAQDPEGFVEARIDGRAIGGGSIVSYDGRYGFMGFFLVETAHRGHGVGHALWYARRDLLRARLAPGAAIGMAAVSAMRAFYERGGFHADHLEVRFAWQTQDCGGHTPAEIVDARSIPFDALAAFDAAHFPAPRPRFLAAWIAPAARHAIAFVEHGRIEGLAVARATDGGHRVGPLFARDERVAESLLDELERRLAGSTLFLDMPESNPAAIALAARRGMREVFRCTRMHLGPSPALPWQRIYAVTSFELG